MSAATLLRVFLKMKYMLHRGGPIVSTHAVFFGGLMADAAVCPEGEADGVAWAMRTPGPVIESFVFGRMLDRISGGHTLAADGKTRTDELVKLGEVPGRIQAMLDDYRAMGTQIHLEKRGSRVGSDACPSSEKQGARSKLPLDPKPVRARKVVPASAAAAAARSAV